MRFFFTYSFIALYLIRPFEFFPPLQGSPILLVCGLLGLASILFSPAGARAKWIETDFLMTGFFAAILFSHASTFYLGGVITSFTSFLPIFLGYFLISHSVITEKQVISILKLVVLVSCGISVIGILQYFKGIPFYGIEPIVQNKVVNGELITLTRIQWVGPFSDPNDLALLFVIPIPFLLARFRENMIIAAIACAILVLGIYCTNSRGGQLSLIVAVIMYFTLRYHNTKGLILGLVLCSALLVLGPSRMGELSAQEGSAYGRLDAWYEGFQMFKVSPLFGVGQGMFTDFHILTAHNSFVLVMAELGLLGLFFFVGLFWVPLKKIAESVWQEKRQVLSTQDLALLSSLAASLAALIVAMTFLSRSYILVPYMLVALIIRLLNSYEPGAAFSEQWGKLSGQIIVLMFFSIAFINVMIKLLL